jgi:hypothetical protein
VLLATLLDASAHAQDKFALREEETEFAEPAGAAAAQGSRDSTWNTDPSAWTVIIYPVYGVAPIFGAHVNLPSLPNGPGGGSGIPPSSGLISTSLNGAAFAGFEIDKSKWSATGTFLWGGLSGDHNAPKVHIGLDILYGQLMVGREIVDGLTLEGGFRRSALKITADVGSYPEVTRKPGVWDPLVGITYRKVFARKWRFEGHLDGGGFGVGADVSVNATARFDWRFARHFGVTMGGTALHFQLSDTVLHQTLTIRQTFYGPVFGFGIYF